MLKFPALKLGPISSNPWFYFLSFLATNTLLSYFGLPSGSKMWVGSIGLVLPWVMAFIAYRPATNSLRARGPDTLPAIPTWAWVILGGLALFARFYKIGSLSVWPHYDEGMTGFYALKVLRQGFDRFFYICSQNPPLYFGWLCLHFKYLGTSPTVLWLCPALLYLLLVPLTYGAARPYLGKPLALFCAFLSAFSFWPLFAGRFSVPAILTPLFEAWVFLCMGKLLFEARNDPDRKKKAVMLGVSLGLGFYANYYYWIAIALMVTMTVAWSYFRKNSTVVVVFLISLLIVVLPFGFFAFQQGISAYIKGLWAGGAAVSLSRVDLLKAYLGSIFWGIPSDTSYRPFWGGFLNPILGSLFFLGSIVILKNRAVALHRWLIFAFVFFLLPGVLSTTMETFRIIPIWVVIFPVIAVGWGRLIQEWPARRAIMALGLILLSSFGLDLYHLLGPYQAYWDSPENWVHSVKSINNFRAYGILKAKAETDGPGLILTRLPSGICDPTLEVAVDDFNAASNPRWRRDEAKWAALVVNVNYQPFVSSLLGPGKDYWLSKDLHSPDGGTMLMVVPIDGSNRGILGKWSMADGSLKDFNDHYFQDLSAVGGDLTGIELSLQKAYPAFRGNPFLEACFWEKAADLDIKRGQIDQAIQDLRKATRLGCGAAHLFYRSGVLQLARQDPAKAEKAFRQATKAPLDFTTSKQLLATQFK